MFLVDGQLDTSGKGIQPLCHDAYSLKLPQSSDGALLLIPCNIQQKGDGGLGIVPVKALSCILNNKQLSLQVSMLICTY